MERHHLDKTRGDYSLFNNLHVHKNSGVAEITCFCHHAKCYRPKKYVGQGYD